VDIDFEVALYAMKRIYGENKLKYISEVILEENDANYTITC